MEISHPRRVLLLGPQESGHLEFLTKLTGSAPTPTTNTLAGLSHSLQLRTTYYAATLPIWLDEISLTSPSSWSTDFLGPEAAEVLAAIGAFIVIFRKPVTDADFTAIKNLLEEVGKVVKDGCGWSWEGVCLAVGLRQDVLPNLKIDEDDFVDFCREHGFEYVDGEGEGKNEFNEPTGMVRVKEALETNDWEGAGDDTGFEDLEGDDLGFGAEATELEMEMFGMKQAIYGQEDGEHAAGGSGQGNEDEEEDVEQLEAMMRKLQAVKDMSAGLSEAERKKFAAKAINDIMKTM